MEPMTTFLKAQHEALRRHSVEAEERFVDIPSLEGQTQVLVSGSGPAVVLLNGIGTPAAMWAPLMGRLEGVTVYAVDLHGFGRCEASPDVAGDYRGSAVAFLDDVLDGLGLDAVALVGSSLGSLWASWYALERPDRVTAIAHVGCPAIVLDTSAPLPMRLLSILGLGRVLMRVDPPSPAQVARLSKTVGEHPLPSEIADLLLATERLPGFGDTLRGTLHALVRLRGNRPEWALGPDALREIEQPTLLVLGADDPFGSVSVGEEVVAHLRQGRLEVVDGGHAPWLRGADQVGRAVASFLAQHTGLTAGR